MREASTPVGAAAASTGCRALVRRRRRRAIHLRHRNGEYNAPFARGILAGRNPVLVHLWRREQGLLVPPGNPRGVDRSATSPRLRVARRPSGTGTRMLLDRLLLDAGLEPQAISGPN